MRLHPECTPDAADGHPTKARDFGQFARTPVCLPARRGLECLNDDLLDLLIGDFAWRSRPRFIIQSLQARLEKPRPRHCVRSLLQSLAPDRKSIAMSSRSRESHPEPLTEPCVNLSIYTALVIQPHSRKHASGRTIPDSLPSPWRAIPRCAACAATASYTCVWPTAQASDRCIERALASQFDRKLRSIPPPS
jgi:hypothetical protein